MSPLFAIIALSSTVSLARDPTIDGWVAEALSQRPELRALEARVAAARARVPQAGALADPVVQFGIQNDGFAGIELGKMETSYLLLMASETFPWPGKRDLRVASAEWGAQAEIARLGRARLDAEAEVRSQVLSLLLSEERLRLVEERGRLWSQAEHVARARYEAGDGPQSDILRAQLERSRLRQRMRNLETEATQARYALNRLRGQRLDAPVRPPWRLTALREPDAIALDLATSEALRVSPELLGARAQVARATQELSLAERSYFPDITVGLSLMPRGGSFPPMWQATVGVSLPVFSGARQDPQVREAEANVQATSEELAEVEALLRLRVGERQVALEAVLDILSIYRGGLLIQSRATAESTLAQYSVGKVPMASVLEAIAGVVGDEDDYLSAVAEAQQIAIARTRVGLEPTTTAAVAQGAMPRPEPPKDAPSGTRGGM